MGSRIQMFRSKAATGQYELTGHAKDEMEQDDFAIQDVKAAIYNGKIIVSQRDQSMKKYMIEGKSGDGRKMRLVCRLTGLKRLRIITVFEV